MYLQQVLFKVLTLAMQPEHQIIVMEVAVALVL